MNTQQHELQVKGMSCQHCVKGVTRAIQEQDYTVIQTITNLMIFITATGVLIIDLLYPLIDPRITFKRNTSS